MIVRVVLACLLLAAGPAMAEPFEPISIPGGGPPEPQGPPPPPALQLFFSPAGEPFRAAPEDPYPVAAWFSRADANHDGVLTQSEFSDDSLAFFDRLDTDKDQVVDGFETADYEKAIAPEITTVLRRPQRPQGLFPAELPPNRAERAWGMPSMIPRRGDRPAQPQRQGAAQFALLNEPHPVRGGDGDLDQRISRAEALTAARKRFSLLDVDGDGRLALADLPKTPVQDMIDRAPEGGRRKAPPKRVEMRLQLAAVNAIGVARLRR
jgi:hypothetical protein